MWRKSGQGVLAVHGGVYHAVLVICQELLWMGFEGLVVGLAFLGTCL